MDDYADLSSHLQLPLALEFMSHFNETLSHPEHVVFCSSLPLFLLDPLTGMALTPLSVWKNATNILGPGPLSP